MNPASISNNKLSLLRKLKQKKYRQQEQLFVIEGSRAVEQIIKNDQLKIETLFFDENQHYWQQKYWREVAKTMAAYTAAYTINEEDFAEVSDTDHPQGVMAMCRLPAEFNPKQMVQQKGLIIATDAIQDPGNLGTIIRTASWFGVQGLLSGKGTVDLFHPKVVRSTAGATGTVPHINIGLRDALSFFEKQGWQIVLLDATKEAIPLRDVSKKEKMIIVIGNEAHGIDPSLFSPARLAARIVSANKERNVESLNAAVAVSIAMHALS